MTGIYKITNKVNGKCYIGQSIHIQDRWKTHINEAKGNRKNSILYLAMRKYGIENFDFEVIEECTKEKLNEREIYWISYYDSFNKGYNMTQGGESGIIIKQEVVDKINEMWNQGSSIGEIEKELQGKVCKKTITKYLKLNPTYSIHESRARGAIRYKNPNYSSLHIKQYTLSGEFIAEYISCKEAGNALNIDPDLIGRALNGLQAYAGGFQWKRGDDPPKDISKKVKSHYGVIQYDLQGNELNRYASVKEAVLAINGKSYGLTKACRHQISTYYGYKWEYDYSVWTK